MSDTLPLPAAAPPAPAAAGGLAGKPRLPRSRRLLAAGALLAFLVLAGAAIAPNVRALYHLHSGRTDLKRHHNAEARNHFQICLHTWPKDSEVLLLSARASWRLQEFEQSHKYLKDYQQAAGASDDFVRESFFLMAAQGEIDKAKPYCRQLIDDQDQAAPLALEALVTGCSRQYRFAEADVFLKQWLDMQPNDTQALLFEISQNQLRSNPEEAVAGYRRVLQLDAEHDAARFRLADLLVELRRCQEAMPHLEILRQRQPGNAQVLVLVAKCQDSLGQQAEAEALLDQVLIQAPHHASALAERGRLALRREQLAEAETWLRHALTHEPGNFQAHYHLGQCLLQRGRTEEVVRQQHRLKQLEADQKRLRRIMAHEMSRQPHDAALHHEVAMILLRSGAVESSVRWLHSALREDPTLAAAHGALAEYYQETGQRELAALHRRFVLKEPAPAGKTDGTER